MDGFAIARGKRHRIIIVLVHRARPAAMLHIFSRIESADT
jgi:hypothetical protein